MRFSAPLRRLFAGVVCAIALMGCRPEPVPPEAAVDAYARDGDTLSVTIGGVDEIVRLLGVDAPEQDACGADEAKARLGELTHGRALTIVHDPYADERDRFGRILGYVEVDGVDVGLQMITEGRAAAWWPRSEPEPERGRDYADAERTARDDAVGSWAMCETMGR